MITLSFRNEKELANFITKVATPIAQRIAEKAANDVANERLGFRTKKETATPQSSIETINKFIGGGSAIRSVTGSRSASAFGTPIPALTSLLNALSSAGLIQDNSTT